MLEHSRLSRRRVEIRYWLSVSTRRYLEKEGFLLIEVPKLCRDSPVLAEQLPVLFAGKLVDV